MSLAVYVVAAMVILRFLLVAAVVGVALKTDDPKRRNAALTILRILQPSGRRRKLPPRSS